MIKCRIELQTFGHVSVYITKSEYIHLHYFDEEAALEIMAQIAAFGCNKCVRDKGFSWLSCEQMSLADTVEPMY